MEQEGHEEQGRDHDHQGFVEPVMFGFVKNQVREIGPFGSNGEAQGVRNQGLERPFLPTQTNGDSNAENAGREHFGQRYERLHEFKQRRGGHHDEDDRRCFANLLIVFGDANESVSEKDVQPKEWSHHCEM